MQVVLPDPDHKPAPRLTVPAGVAYDGSAMSLRMSRPATMLLAVLLASACSQPQTQPNAPETLSMEAGIRPVYASPNARRYHKDRSCKDLRP